MEVFSSFNTFNSTSKDNKVKTVRRTLHLEWWFLTL